MEKDPKWFLFQIFIHSSSETRKGKIVDSNKLKAYRKDKAPEHQFSKTSSTSIVITNSKCVIFLSKKAHI